MSVANLQDQMILTVHGISYTGWTDVRASRGIDRCASDFNITLSENWFNQANGIPQYWPVKPFDPVMVSIGSDPVITGYVEVYDSQIEAKNHTVRITGRSKTGDLVECTPDIASGQFKGANLAQIANTICALFGIAVTVDPSAAAAVQNAVADSTMERSETAFTFLERLGRLAGVLLSDTPKGNLLITRVGDTRASPASDNFSVISLRSKLDVRKRFSDYIVKGQSGVAGGAGGSPFAGLHNNQTGQEAPNTGTVASTAGPVGGVGQVQTTQAASAHDAGVPRYRPKVSIAESQLTGAGLQLRATWQMHYGLGRSIDIVARVQGWRQANGALWAINQILSCRFPEIGIDQDLLIIKVEFRLGDKEGRITELTLGLPEGYTPDPGQVKLRKHKGEGKGAAINGFDGLAKVGPVSTPSEGRGR